MTYIGQQPSTTFDSGIQDRFTGLSSNTVTLTHDISAETDILVVWNNIVQDSSTYSVGGAGNKTLTLGGTLVSADVVTVYYLNKVMQSVNPTAGSVTSTTITDDIISGQTALGAEPADTDEFIVSDAGTLKRVDYSHIKAGTNTPTFHIRKSSNQTGLSSGGWTKVTFDDEVFDSDNTFASDKFTAPSNGKYFFTAAAKINDGGTNTLVGSGMRFTINGAIAAEEIHFMVNGSNSAEGKSVTAVLNLTASQYVEVYAYAQDNGGAACSITGGNDRDTFFMGFKLIT